MPTSSGTSGSVASPPSPPGPEPVRILVTGADGFVGGHLLRALARDREHRLFAGHGPHTAPGAAASIARLEGLDAGIEVLPLDVTSTASLAAAIAHARPDQVYHLAAQSSVGRSFDDPIGTWEVNATGTLRLAEALRATGASTRLLVISSVEVYGAVPLEQQPIDESYPLRPSTPYGASKAAAEIAALQAAAAGGLEVIVARSFNHAGPGQDERFVFPGMALQLARMQHNDFERVLRVGNLQVHRDYLDVRDVVRAYLTLMQAGESGGIYNVCSGQSRSLETLVTRLAELSGTGARIEVDPERLRPVDIPVQYGSAERLRALGWEPRITLEQTLTDLLVEARERVAAEGA